MFFVVAIDNRGMRKLRGPRTVLGDPVLALLISQVQIHKRSFLCNYHKKCFMDSRLAAIIIKFQKEISLVFYSFCEHLKLFIALLFSPS